MQHIFLSASLFILLEDINNIAGEKVDSVFIVCLFLFCFLDG